MLKDTLVPSSMVDRQDRVSLVVQGLNVAVPLLESASGTAQTLMAFVHHKQIVWLKVSLDICTYLVGALEVLSGACLIYAVFQINRYVKSSTDSNINKRALLLHASAFGLYLASVIVLDSCYAYYQINQDALSVYLNSEIFWAVASFLSQGFLCAIFWDLGRKRHVEARLQNESYPEIEVLDFDEHAELQARIWNQFMRTPLLSSEGSDNEGILDESYRDNKGIVDAVSIRKFSVQSETDRTVTLESAA